MPAAPAAAADRWQEAPPRPTSHSARPVRQQPPQPGERQLHALERQLLPRGAHAAQRSDKCCAQPLPSATAAVVAGARAAFCGGGGGGGGCQQRGKAQHLVNCVQHGLLGNAAPYFATALGAAATAAPPQRSDEPSAVPRVKHRVERRDGRRLVLGEQRRAQAGAPAVVERVETFVVSK